MISILVDSFAWEIVFYVNTYGDYAVHTLGTTDLLELRLIDPNTFVMMKL